MLVFVDESGDSGLKVDEGSSHVFVLTLVIFRCHIEANAVDELIRHLRNEMKMHPQSEFKFNRLRESGRKQFLTTVAQRDFVYYSMVINKSKIYSKGLSYKEPFYKYVCSLAFENAKHLLEEAIIVIDGSGSREFRQQLQNYLKRKVNDKSEPIPCIKKVKMEDSKKNNLLQLADMVCGAVARVYKKTDKDDSYRRIIKTREGYVQFWPK
jgi:hypothetical protein